MQTLRVFFGVDNKALSDEAIILLRLLGRSFLCPINFDIGERPETALVAYLKQGHKRPVGAKAKRSTTPFLNIIAALIDYAPDRSDDIDEVTTDILRKTTQLDRSSVALSAIGVLEDAGVPVDEKRLALLARRLNPLPPLDGDSLGVCWHLVLSKFAMRSVSDDEVPLSQQAVLSDEFLGGPIYVVAKTRPFLFIDTVVHFLFSALAQATIPEKRVAAILDRAMPVAFSQLYRKGRNRTRIERSLSLLAGQLDVLTQFGRFNRVAESVMQSAAEASFTGLGGGSLMPFRDIALLEAGLSRGKARSTARILGNRRTELETILRRYAEPVKKKIQVTKGSRPDPILATNLIPYSEGIYFLIWKGVLEHAGIVVELKQLEWGKIIPALLQDHLSFVIWNDVVAAAQRKNVAMRVTDRPLLEYRNYPLVVRRDVAERLLTSLPEREKKTLVAVLGGGVPMSLEGFKACPRLIRALRGEKIGLVGNSDIQEVALMALGRLQRIEHVSSDEAVERLIDGEISTAVLGAVQAAYINRRFGESAITLAIVQRDSGTPVHLWFNQKTFEERGYDKLAPALLEAWRMTFRIWNEVATSQSRENQLLRQWIESLAYRLNVGAEGQSEGLRAPIEGWSELHYLWSKHDNLRTPSRIRKASFRPLALPEAQKILKGEMAQQTSDNDSETGKVITLSDYHDGHRGSK